MVACRLLKENADIPIDDLLKAAHAVSNKTLGARWTSREACPSSLAAGKYLQAAYPELQQVQLDTPEGLIVGLGYALTCPGHTFQFHQAATAEERSGLAGVHQWSIMLPTSARVAQEVYEPLIGIHYPMLCAVKNGEWSVGTVSIRAEERLATGFRFVHSVHDGASADIRAAPPPAATSAAYQQIEHWLPANEEDADNILVLTTRTNSAQHLQGFFKQSGRRANAETAVKVAGATAKHCIVLHGKSTFLSGTSGGTDIDHECYARANVAYSRATDLTISACPLNMHGTTGVTQVIAALLHGACTLHTSDQSNESPWVEGYFTVDQALVSESTATFAKVMEPQPLWKGLLPVCLVEYHQGQSRRLRLIVVPKTVLKGGELAFLDYNHSVYWKLHSSGLLFAYAADRQTEPAWIVLPDVQQPHAWRLLHADSKGGTRFSVGEGLRYAQGQAKDAAIKAKEYQFEALHKIYFYDAWRLILELDQPESPLRLPPQPGLLRNGCYWPPSPPSDRGTSPPHNAGVGVLAQVSLSDTSSHSNEDIASPSEVPEPTSRSQAATSPISPIEVGSTEEEDDASNATEQSRFSGPIEIVGSPSAKEPDTSPEIDAEPEVDGEAQGAPMGEERAQETESSTTDAVLEIDVDEEAAPAPSEADPVQARVPTSACIPGSKSAGEVVQNAMHSDGIGPNSEKTGTKRPASIADLHGEDSPQAEADNADADEAAMTAVAMEGGHPCGCPTASDQHQGATPPAGKAPRRNRWTPAMPALPVTHTSGEERSDPPCSPTSPVEPAHPASTEAPAPPAGSQPRLVGPVAVKTKAAKPAKAQKLPTAEQEMVDAIQSRLPPPLSRIRVCLVLL